MLPSLNCASDSGLRHDATRDPHISFSLLEIANAQPSSPLNPRHYSASIAPALAVGPGRVFLFRSRCRVLLTLWPFGFGPQEQGGHSSLFKPLVAEQAMGCTDPAYAVLAKNFLPKSTMAMDTQVRICEASGWSQYKMYGGSECQSQVLCSSNPSLNIHSEKDY